MQNNCFVVCPVYLIVVPFPAATANDDDQPPSVVVQTKPRKVETLIE